MITGDRQRQIEDDLRRSPRGLVLYMEGKTDPSMLAALLGREPPQLDLLDGVVVRGLSSTGVSGSGSSSVRALLECATAARIPGVYGVVDGDGEALGTLRSRFDEPYRGPLFTWPAYCLESLLARAGIPSDWGISDDLDTILVRYSPLVAANRLQRHFRVRLETLGLHRIQNPKVGSYPRAADAQALFEAGAAELQSLHVGEELERGRVAFEDAVARDLGEALAMLNGKWLVQHFGPTETSRSPEACRDDWLKHARGLGGLPEVKAFWDRLRP